jgi:hypothetical protein
MTKIISRILSGAFVIAGACIAGGLTATEAQAQYYYPQAQPYYGQPQVYVPPRVARKQAQQERRFIEKFGYQQPQPRYYRQRQQPYYYEQPRGYRQPGYGYGRGGYGGAYGGGYIAPAPGFGTSSAGDR